METEEKIYTALDLRHDMRALMRGEVTLNDLEHRWADDLMREILDWGAGIYLGDRYTRLHGTDSNDPASHV